MSKLRLSAAMQASSMPDPARSQSSGWSLALGTAFGMAATAIAAFVVGALYQCVASRTSIEDFNQLLVFTPVVVTSICSGALLTYRFRRTAAIVLALFSAAGMAVLLLESDWGGGIVDASPAFTKRYNQYTYLSDALFFFAHSVQLASAALVLIAGRMVRGARERQGRNSLTGVPQD